MVAAAVAVAVALAVDAGAIVAVRIEGTKHAAESIAGVEAAGQARNTAAPAEAQAGPSMPRTHNLPATAAARAAAAATATAAATAAATATATATAAGGGGGRPGASGRRNQRWEQAALAAPPGAGRSDRRGRRSPRRRTRRDEVLASKLFLFASRRSVWAVWSVMMLECVGACTSGRVSVLAVGWQDGCPLPRASSRSRLSRPRYVPRDTQASHTSAFYRTRWSAPLSHGSKQPM